ncbi:hypothetical protein [Elusimicrobium minutum]|nr:hypothetical protein [Elusimicrobium minutum]
MNKTESNNIPKEGILLLWCKSGNIYTLLSVKHAKNLKQEISLIKEAQPLGEYSNNKVVYSYLKTKENRVLNMYSLKKIFNRFSRFDYMHI